MFGYVRPSDRRLTEEERETFRAAYCGLCHALGASYGPAGRMILNYDLTFLAMVLSEGGGTCEKRCAVHPFRKRRCACGDAAMDTAAGAWCPATPYWTFEILPQIGQRVEQRPVQVKNCKLIHGLILALSVFDAIIKVAASACQCYNTAILTKRDEKTWKFIRSPILTRRSWMFTRG